MTVIARARALKQPNLPGAVRHACARRARQPALVAARQYWSCRHSSAGLARWDRLYGYMRIYPQRPLPQYSEYARGLDQSYIAAVSTPGRQTRRRSSWTPEDEPEDASRRLTSRRNGKDLEVEGQDPWETRTRLAGERYLKLMEQHMKVLRKDPYWGLFGSSELRGVWNPWKKYYEMHKQAVRAKAGSVSNLEDARPIPESSQRFPSAQSSQTKGLEELDEEYRLDPISNKKVRRAELPSAIVKNETNDGSTKITVKKFEPSEATKAYETSSKVKRGTASTERSKLSGFARQPWLIQEGFVPPLPNISHLAGKDVASSPWSSPQKFEGEGDLSPNKTFDTKHPSRQAFLANLQTEAHEKRVPSVSDTSVEKGCIPHNRPEEKREKLDQLLPSDVRATTGKAVSQSSELSVPMIQRWAEIETSVSQLFQDREERLNREFAADKWELKRFWNAYPGEILQTFEEKRARRRLLERSFSSSLNKFEHDIAKILGIANTSSTANIRDSSTKAEVGMNIHSYESMRTVARHIQTMREELNARYTREAKQREAERKHRESQAILLQEIDKQKAAMTAYETRPRMPRQSTGQHSAASDKIGGHSKRIASHTEIISKNQIKSSKEQSLIDEIKSIYEEGYGATSLRSPKDSESAQSHKTVTKPGESSTGNAGLAYAKEPKHTYMDSQQVLEASIRDFEKMMHSSKRYDNNVAQTGTVSKAGEAKSSQVLTPDYVKKPTPVEGPRTQATDGISTQNRKPNSYLLLAYDKAGDKVRIVRTTSSKYEDMSARRTVDSILSRLDNPVPYIDHIERLENSGYELVAGSRKLLVYRDKLNRTSDSLIELGGSTSKSRGWGAPERDSSLSDKAASGKESSNRTLLAKPAGVSQRVRRMEEKFSGPGPRFTEPAENTLDQNEEEKHRSRFARTIRVALMVVGIIYACGFSLEWLKEREKQRLIKEYQQEVRRVKDMERRRALEEKSAASRWGF